MTLGFKTHINDTPTHFVEKIWQCIIYDKSVKIDLADLIIYQSRCLERGYKIVTNFPKKLHTIRADPHNRWKPGNKIHMVTGNRTKHRFQFAPVLECISTQDIEIKWTSSRHYKKIFELFIDGEIYGDAFGAEEITDVSKAIYDLAINDGFDSLDDFFSWFNADFTGKIIHWTDYHYS